MLINPAGAHHEAERRLVDLKLPACLVLSLAQTLAQTDKHYSLDSEDDSKRQSPTTVVFRTTLTWTIMSRYFPAFQEQK